jgi:hypothetical protein
VQEQFAEKFPETPVAHLWGAAKYAVYRDRPRTLNELKTAITAYIRYISQADLQKVFANSIISIAYSERVFVALGIQYALRMLLILVCDLPDYTIFSHAISCTARFKKMC